MAKRYAPTRLPDGRGVFPTHTAVHYKEPELLRRVPVPGGGGELRLEALSPFGDGPPAIRWTAEFRTATKLETIQSYLQMPHHGMTQLHGAEADRIINDDLQRLIRLIERKRAQALPGLLLPPA